MYKSFYKSLIIFYTGWATVADTTKLVSWPQHMQDADVFENDMCVKIECLSYEHAVTWRTRYFHCQAIGKFPRKNNCNIFHICIFPKMYTIEEFTCPPGKSLDTISQMCLDQEIAICKIKGKKGKRGRHPSGVGNATTISSITTFVNEKEHDFSTSTYLEEDLVSSDVPIAPYLPTPFSYPESLVSTDTPETSSSSSDY